MGAGQFAACIVEQDRLDPGVARIDAEECGHCTAPRS
jgi:hypothetical protein